MLTDRASHVWTCLAASSPGFTSRVSRWGWLNNNLEAGGRWGFLSNRHVMAGGKEKKRRREGRRKGRRGEGKRARREGAGLTRQDPD